MNKNDIANVKRDLFLLENQLPYIVLEKLMEGHKEYEWEDMIKNFITMCRRLPPAVKPWISSASSYFFKSPRKHGFQSPLHLLDTTRTRFVRQSATFPSRHCQVQDMIPLALLDMVRHCMGSRCSPKQNATPSATSDWYSYHLARVLKSMGIWFRPNKTGSFSDVKFESQLFIRGVLTLPPILTDASTKSLMLNLLAFESSYHNNSADNMQQGVVTSYMCFMDSLIDNAEDVMLLRTQNIITNCLGNDQIVADLFNKITSNLVPNRHTYAEAKLGIQNHCNNKFKKWMAEGHHIHFRNPWTLFALFGSLFLLGLTAAQTYLATMQLKQ
ncbi:UPF0481 protein At3g47200-like [Ziziphus jujuba]|uniref:UPF0481 protein At3g47200-like n=1 Tax=Ziziphus jujuba TaxID=326968 RepID=A0ABM4A2Z8_ZIZJJ|nr:UPF0481 protein At3g47200-like [Ziziphus jujuba]